YAHELADYDGTPLNIVHRDVSPHNIFVTYTGQVKLVDFGVARTELNLVQTAQGTIKGKLSYMAPEHWRGKADRRSDIFGMGVCLWEMLTGERLFMGDATEILRRLTAEPIPRVSSLRPDIPPSLDEVIAKAVEKNVSQRFQTAEAMRQELEAFLRDGGHAVT